MSFVGQILSISIYTVESFKIILDLMDNSSFFSMINDLSQCCTTTYSYEKVCGLLKIIESQEIRDFDTRCTTINDMNGDCSCGSLDRSCIYTVALGLFICLTYESDSAQQLSIWKSLYTLSDIPEFSNSVFLNMLSEKHCEQFISQLFVVRDAMSSPPSDTKLPATESANLDDACLLHAKQQLHYIYDHRVDLRVSIRRMLGEAATDGLYLFVHHNPFSGQYGSGSVVNLQGKRVCAILDVVASILDGMCVRVNAEVYSVLEGVEQVESLWSVLNDLVINVLLPLHSPNEMDEWRDQLPVIQVC